MFLNEFKSVQAILLSSLRVLRPRNSRGESVNQPGNMNCSRPLTRRIRELEQAQNRSQSRSIHVREQSASAFSPRQHARQQSVRVRGKGVVSTGWQMAAASDATGHSPNTSRDSLGPRFHHGLTMDIKPHWQWTARAAASACPSGWREVLSFELFHVDIDCSELRQAHAARRSRDRRADSFRHHRFFRHR